MSEIFDNPNTPLVLEASDQALDTLAEKLRQAVAQWDAAGEPLTPAAAAEDADTWLALIERLHIAGRWPFSERDSLTRLRGCRAALRKFLDAENAEKAEDVGA